MQKLELKYTKPPLHKPISMPINLENIPTKQKVAIEFDTVDIQGEKSRRKLMVSCSNQIITDYS